MSTSKVHQIEVIIGDRYIATEVNGRIRITRGDGKDLGVGRWHDDQIIDFSSTAIPDNVFMALEKKIKEAMDRNWDED
jgi:hypothetical protein